MTNKILIIHNNNNNAAVTEATTCMGDIRKIEGGGVLRGWGESLGGHSPGDASLGDTHQR